MPNGVTFCHSKKTPTAIPLTIGQLGVACHSPGTGGPGILNCGGDEPSLARRRIMAEAAASPVAMPSFLGWPSGIDAIEFVRSVLSIDVLFGKYVTSTL